ncbi:hypothetical protein JW707_01665 [Candidatus Woesearchaeota archaeon]|nr:hypothetical protein [Candidatus Woesearchaeota archaeon]
MTLKIGLENIVKSFSGVQIGAKNTAYGIKGLQAGGVNEAKNACWHSNKGWQIGFFDFADEFWGVQTSLLNFCDFLKGVQLGFFGNSIEGGFYGHSSGLQVAMVNDAIKMNGVQVGMQNNAKYFYGVQIGLFCTAGEGRYLQLGFLNRKEGELWYKAHVFVRYYNEKRR